MSADTPNATALEIMRARLQQGVRATPLCIAIMGWLCDTPTAPFVAAAGLYSGDVWLRLSDEDVLERLGSFLDFLDQVHIICVSLNMDEEQAQQVIALARQRFG